MGNRRRENACNICIEEIQSEVQHTLLVTQFHPCERWDSSEGVGRGTVFCILRVQKSSPLSSNHSSGRTTLGLRAVGKQVAGRAGPVDLFYNVP